MKGLPGIIIAVGLGIIGAICNSYYIANKARDYEKVGFIAVKSGVNLKIGDKFKREHLVKVDIPEKKLGNLDKIAVLWEGIGAVIGDPVRRVYSGDELIYRDDLKSPGTKRLPELLAEDEVAMSIAVDSSSFVTSRVNPGDSISFVVPKALPGNSVRTGNSSSIASIASSEHPEVVGPFRILMVGNRTGSKDSFKASGQNTKQENVISVSVKYIEGKFEPKAKRLYEIKQIIGSQRMQVVIHPKAAK